MKDILEETLKLQTLIELYRPKAVTEFQKSLLRTLESIDSKLLNFPSDFSRANLNALKREVAFMIKQDFEPFITNLLDDNLEVVNMAYGVYAGALSDSFVSIPKNAVESILNPNNHLLGQTLKEIQDGLSDKSSSFFRQTIASGLISGDSPASISKTLRDYSDSTLRNHINSIVRTSMNSAMQNAYNVASRLSEEFIGYAFSNGVLDSRTSPICQEQTGRSVKRRDGESYSAFQSRAFSKLIQTPRHINCRSKILFETADSFNDRSSGKRPAVTSSDKRTVNHRDGSTSSKYTNKQVEFYPQDMTYDEFFTQQSPAFQKSVLGDTKYKLYKQGNLEISQIRDITNNTYLTNDEIMKLL